MGKGLRDVSLLHTCSEREKRERGGRACLAALDRTGFHYLTAFTSLGKLWAFLSVASSFPSLLSLYLYLSGKEAHTFVPSYLPILSPNNFDMLLWCVGNITCGHGGTLSLL